LPAEANLLSKEAKELPRVSQEPTVNALHVVDLLSALSRLGLDPAPLARTVGLRQSDLRKSGARIPVSFLGRIFVEAERRTGDPLIGLRAGERAEPRDPLLYLVMAYPRLEDGFRQMERFSHLPLDSMRIRLTREARRAALGLDFGPALEGIAPFVDYVLALVVCALRRTVVSDLPLREVHVRHADWPDPTEAALVFGCPVRCNQPENRLVFPLRALQATSRHGNLQVAAQIEKFLTAQSAELVHTAPFRDRVENAVRAALGSGRSSDRATIARGLHVSGRTLHRRLAGEQVTFTQLREATLWEVAETLLANPAVSVKTVALTVGFADVASFSKAFKRRAGSSPTRYRSGTARARAPGDPGTPGVRAQ
jgi:AraC-like DNA-binding protein